MLPMNVEPPKESRSKSRLLFIDDDSTVLASLRLLFESSYETFSASSVSEGVKVFGEVRPEIVLLDLKLPDMSGIEALRQIRKIDASASVVILTGYSTRLDAEESLRLGAADYMNKPFDATDLKKRIARLADAPAHRSTDAIVEQSFQNFCEFRDLQNASAAFLHDVSGPLSCLMAGTDLLGEKIDEKADLSSEDIVSVTSMMADSVRYLRALIEQWRSFSELHTLMHGKFEVKQAINLAVDQVIKPISATDVVLQIQMQQGHLMLPGNHFAIARVLINLLNNAFEAVSHVNGRIHLTASRTEAGFQFVIADNGPGISPSQISQIFAPRFTTKSSGRGLGLFISNKIVEAIGGKIAVRSPGVMYGTDFTITIPIN